MVLWIVKATEERQNLTQRLNRSCNIFQTCWFMSGKNRTDVSHYTQAQLDLLVLSLCCVCVRKFERRERMNHCAAREYKWAEGINEGRVALFFCSWESATIHSYECFKVNIWTGRIRLDHRRYSYTKKDSLCCYCLSWQSKRKVAVHTVGCLSIWLHCQWGFYIWGLIIAEVADRSHRKRTKWQAGQQGGYRCSSTALAQLPLMHCGQTAQMSICGTTEYQVHTHKYTCELFPTSGNGSSFIPLHFRHQPPSAHCVSVSGLWHGAEQIGPGKEASPKSVRLAPQRRTIVIPYSLNEFSLGKWGEKGLDQKERWSPVEEIMSTGRWYRGNWMVEHEKFFLHRTRTERWGQREKERGPMMMVKRGQAT